MTWGTFAKAIRDAQIIKGALWSIIDDLFKAAGCTTELTEVAVKSWIYGRRNCYSITYFPNKVIDNKKVFYFFRKRPEKKLQDLQKIFQEKADPDSPIDINTHDLDVFCWSLVNQFLDLLEFQRVDIPESTPSAEEPESTPSAEEPESTLSPENKNARKRSVKSLFLPHSSDDCCYHCTHWVGNRTMFGAYITATYGFCIKYNRQEQLSSDLACKDYKKREKSPLEW